MTPKSKALIAYLVVSIIWGTTYPAIRVAVQVFPPGIFAGIRFVTAGVLFLLIAKMLHRPFPGSWREVWLNALPGVIILTFGNGAVMYASQWVHAGIISVFVASVPLWVAFIETIELKRSALSPLGWAGVLLGFGGILLLSITGKDLGSIDALGLLFVSFAVCASATGTWISHRVTSGDLFVRAGLQMLISGILLGVVGLSLGEASACAITPTAVWMMLYLIVVGSLIGYTAFVYILEKLSPTVVSTITYSNTVIALALGILFLGEPYSAKTMVAVVIILLGVAIVQRTKIGDY